MLLPWGDAECIAGEEVDTIGDDVGFLRVEEFGGAPAAVAPKDGAPTLGVPSEGDEKLERPLEEGGLEPRIDSGFSAPDGLKGAGAG